MPMRSFVPPAEKSFEADYLTKKHPVGCFFYFVAVGRSRLLSVAIVVREVNTSALASVDNFYTEATRVVAPIVVVGAVKALITGACYLGVSASWTMVSVSFVDLFATFTAGYVCHRLFLLCFIFTFIYNVENKYDKVVQYHTDRYRFYKVKYNRK